MKKLLSALMVLVLLTCLSTALASSPGTQSDPLVSKTYVDAYGEDLLAVGLNIIVEEMAAFFGSTSEKLLSRDPIETGYKHLAAREGSTLELKSGCSLMMLGGTMTVTVHEGEVIEILTGETVASGSYLQKNHRYFCVEDTRADFIAESNTDVMVEGHCTASDGVSPAFTRYIDMNASGWYYDAAIFAFENAIFPDADSKYFRPEDSTTRAEMVYALWVVSGSPASETTAPFTDLTEDWYIPAVNWSNENGIILGYEDNTFRSGNTMTREELACILYRYSAAFGGDISIRSDLSVFEDQDTIDDWAWEEMSWICAAGIIKGMSPTTVAPRYTSTRAQVSTILMRYISNTTAE